MDRITRKELKTDRFAAEVGHTLEYLGTHRRQTLIVGGVALAVILAAAAGHFYRRHQHTLRQDALRAALRTYDAAVGPGTSPFVETYTTQEEKDKAVAKAFNGIISSHGGSDEAVISKYYLGIIDSDRGRLGEAEKYLREVADSGRQPYASLAKLSLAELLQAQGKSKDAEPLLRGLMAHPTILVSREQATIALAKLLAPARPEEARKLLEPLRTERSAVSRNALTVLSEIPAQPGK